ncbi:unnamed protein product [[Actinomadura] parvosata subsp. kistnae]|uniref:Uncharacterized protein n=1 Tax=[Actinomadura] parvosata subsp. kistnae TaxID=1909395 RepID=A0A1V0A9V6_9ACTN|nr:hypothetical protein [Nonomuraea sp. ATCC 55076]AQZ66996.1 hypothetical protein BKM31_41050 [Nonomuraea sp. ATCC 55076]SPL94835.1 unnamed protein product [Actinomadura parvosata subsp. kistnae]
MADTSRAQAMPRTLKVAQFIITLQVAFGLVGLALVLVGFFSTFDWRLLPVLVYAALVPALLGWLLSRWSSRRAFLRWAIIAVQVLVIGVTMLDLVLHSTVTWGAVFGSRMLGWAVIVLLLLPQAGRWFNASRA